MSAFSKRLSSGALVLCLLACLGLLVGRPAMAQAFTVLHAFDPSTDQGYGPNRTLMKGTDGNFYGRATNALTGAILFYRVTPAGAYTRLSEFPTDYVSTDIVSGDDGFFYGVGGGGANGHGAFIKLDTSGVMTVIRDFTASDPYLLGVESLMHAGDGNFYVITAGTPGWAFVKLTPGGTATQIFSFGSVVDPNGAYPIGRLVDGGDGKLYDASTFGGANGVGTFFRIAYDGTFEKLHDFTVAERPHIYGSFPGNEGLMRADDGAFYYACPFCGNNSGVVFRYTTAGAVSVVTSGFGGPGTGFSPIGRLVQAGDGNFYGTTQSGTTGLSSLYQMTPGGSLTFFKFLNNNTDGYNLETGLVLGDDGIPYGTASQGGPSQGSGGAGGTAFKAALTPSVLSIAPSSGPAAGGTPATITGTTFVGGAGALIGGVAATSVSVTNPTTMAATTPALSPGTLNDVQVTNPDTTFGIGQKLFFADFLDVAQADIFHTFVEKLIRNGITAGCGGGNYCRNDAVKRKQMAVFLLKAKLGPAHVPPPATGTVFNDVPASDPFAPWIEELASLSITGGCGGGAFCPEAPVRRDQMAVFLLKAFEGSAYTPPACAGLFLDVACTPTPAFAVDWIEELYNRAVTGGCIPSPLQYCPLSSVLRGQMSAFLTKTFGLP